jgi:hypothetical protein
VGRAAAEGLPGGAEDELPADAVGELIDTAVVLPRFVGLPHRFGRLRGGPGQRQAAAGERVQPDGGVSGRDEFQAAAGVGGSVAGTSGPQRDHGQGGARPGMQGVVVDHLAVGERGACLFVGGVGLPEVVGGGGHEAGQLPGDQVQVGDLGGAAGAFEHPVGQVAGTLEIKGGCAP